MGEDKTPETTEPQATPAEPPAEVAPSAPERPAPSGMPDYVRFPLVLAVVTAAAALCLALVYDLTRERIEKAEGRKVAGAYASILGERFASAVDKTFAVKPADGAAKPTTCSYSELRDAGGSVIAYATQVACDGSYNSGDPIKLMVILDPDLKTVLGIRVISSKETPGFGERVNDTTAPKSLLGLLAGREEKTRVVLAPSGTRVGIAQKANDGSVRLALPDGGTETIPSEKIAAVTSAPFPPAFVDQFTGVSVKDAGKLGGPIDALMGATITSRAVVGGVAKASEQLATALAGE